MSGGNRGYPPWRRRLWNLRPWQRNPLMRAGLRVESLLRLLLAALVVAAVPTSVEVGQRARTAIERRAEHDLADSQVVAATVVQAPDSVRWQSTVGARAQWSHRGHVHTGVVRVVAPVRRGERVPVRVDADGNQLAPPPTTSMATANGIAVTVGILGIVVLAVGTAVRALRRAVARRQDRGWTAEWAILAKAAGRDSR